MISGMVLLRALMLLIYLILGCHRMYSLPVPAEVSLDPSTYINRKSLEFLWDKGYLGSNRGVGQLKSRQQVIKALKRFQEFTGIPITGQLDTKTIEYMQKPRCGMPDVTSSKRRRKRYNHQGTYWLNTRLTWALENSNNDGISNYDVRRTLTLAFSKWQAVTNIYFTELVNRPIDSALVRVRFVQGKHGDPFAFDGPGGTLAHAFYPLNNKGLAGDVHFDDAERFSIDPDAGKDYKKLLWVAVHEIGHTIGLDHSSTNGAIMYPYYRHFKGHDLNLTYDDIQGAQTIYGGKFRTRRPTPLPPKTARPSLGPTKPFASGCTDVMKAAILGNDNKLYVINSDKYYILHEYKEGIEKGPMLVGDFFKPLSNIDTVFRRHNDRYLVVFHGDKFSVYDNNRLVSPPREINYGFQGIDMKLENIDTAFVWPYNRKLYIFKGENYWRFSQLPNKDYVVDFGYPQLISAKWIGLPKSVDSAFEWSNKKMYFTKGQHYYRWNIKRNEVHSGYPIKLSRSFLKCYT